MFDEPLNELSCKIFLEADSAEKDLTELLAEGATSEVSCRTGFVRDQEARSANWSFVETTIAMRPLPDNSPTASCTSTTCWNSTVVRM